MGKQRPKLPGLARCVQGANVRRGTYLCSSTSGAVILDWEACKPFVSELLVVSRHSFFCKCNADSLRVSRLSVVFGGGETAQLRQAAATATSSKLLSPLNHRHDISYSKGYCDAIARDASH